MQVRIADEKVRAELAEIISGQMVDLLIAKAVDLNNPKDVRLALLSANFGMPIVNLLIEPVTKAAEERRKAQTTRKTKG